MSQKVTVQTTNFETDSNQMDIINTQNLKNCFQPPQILDSESTELFNKESRKMLLCFFTFNHSFCMKVHIVKNRPNLKL